MAKPNDALFEAAKKAGALGKLDDGQSTAHDDEVDDDEQGEETKSDEGIEPNPPESDDGDDDLSKFPENYFGKDVRAFAKEHGAEAAEEYFNTLKEASRVVSTRLQELREAEKAAEEARKAKAAEQLAAEPEDTEPEEISDEDLLSQNGFDPDLLQYEEVGKPIVALLRRQLALEENVQSQSQEQQNAAWENQFFSRVDELAGENGKITFDDGTPVDRATLTKYAIENDIYNADALYWNLMGPILAKGTPTFDPAKRERKRQISGTRRKGGSPGSTSDKAPRTLADHFNAAKKEHGVEGDPFAHPE